ncbi:MAG: FecR domain-containing protein [Abitibacteriaceae bacterium]|nr:FecR domain-containing protein [Abditibacteriaceae bacterium]MBV9866314.1 FecR domain-containing protein [Abditibacteriaceae bacterium]
MKTEFEAEPVRPLFQLPLSNQRRGRALTRRRVGSHRHWSGHGFTLVQMLVVLSIIAIMAATLLGLVGKARATAQKAQCDARLKAIVLAWDAYRQEHGHSPLSLKQLRDAGYLPADLMRCPADPRPEGAENDEDYLIIRAPRDKQEFPLIVCPFHEGNGHAGAQGFVGRYTTQYKAAPAILVGANDTTVQRPQDTQPIAATQGMELHGGDRIRTGAQGSAVIRFADGTTSDSSTATLESNSDLTVLQSFLDGQLSGPWYTVVRQRAGKAFYHVHKPNNFDVVTPTATAGAHGTDFSIEIGTGPGNTDILTVTSGEVWVSNPQKIVRGLLNPILPGGTLTLPILNIPLL